VCVCVCPCVCVCACVCSFARHDSSASRATWHVCTSEIVSVIIHVWTSYVFFFVIARTSYTKNLTHTSVWHDSFSCGATWHVRTATRCNMLQHKLCISCNSANDPNEEKDESQRAKRRRRRPILSQTCKLLTHCNTLQHTATHCIMLQHTATRCNTLQHMVATEIVPASQVK